MEWQEKTICYGFGFLTELFICPNCETKFYADKITNIKFEINNYLPPNYCPECGKKLECSKRLKSLF